MAVILLAVASPVLARVGGGESFGGGGSGSGGGGDIDLIFFLIRLCIYHPTIGIPVSGIAIGFYVYKYRGAQRPGRSAAATEAVRKAARRQVSITSATEKLLLHDPYFSIHLFLDFIQLLYTQVHEGRGTGGLRHLLAHLSPEVLKKLSPSSPAAGQNRLQAVDNVIVGAARVLNIRGVDTPVVSIIVEFEANYTEVWKAGAAKPQRRDLYARERWTFRKNRDAPSKGPEHIAALRCPSCGASSELSLEGRCPYCEQVVNTGAFHWVLQDFTVLEKRAKRPIEVTKGGGVEVGTELATVLHPEIQARRRAFEAENPDFVWRKFEAFARRTFLELQSAWTDMKWERARAFETDHLFSTHRFWIERYRSSGLNNRVENVTITRLMPVKFMQDAFFDSITVRIWAAANDFTVDRSGKVVAGSRKAKRVFSEYWTFIRRLSSQRREIVPPKDPEQAQSCPGCGGPIDLLQTAICGYCGAKVTSGEFDWVVSMIEQDEVYSG